VGDQRPAQSNRLGFGIVAVRFAAKGAGSPKAGPPAGAQLP